MDDENLILSELRERGKLRPDEIADHDLTATLDKLVYYDFVVPWGDGRYALTLYGERVAGERFPTPRR